MHRWLSLILGVGVTFTIGCGGGTYEARKPAQLSVSIETPGSSVPATFTRGGTYVIPSPSKFGGVSFLDLTLYNLGEDDTQVLNVYLGEGTNQYVELLWGENDPTPAWTVDSSLVPKYTFNETVIACPPDFSSVSNDSLLLPPLNANPASCMFPMILPGQDSVTKVFRGRKVRLKYTFDAVNDLPDESPVNLIIHISEKEDSLTEEGVLFLPIEVAGCTPSMLYGPTAVTFAAAKPNQAETQQICITNEGCEDLVVSSIYLEHPSPGEVWVVKRIAGICDDGKTSCFEDIECGADGACTGAGKPLQNTVVKPLAEAPGEELCFFAIYAPFNETEGDTDSNQVIIESNDPVQPKAAVPLSKGDCPYAYVVEHEDMINSGNDYLDFSGVSPGDTGERWINVLNDGFCPITLKSIAFGGPGDLFSNGGSLWAEVRKAGETVGHYGYPGQSLPPVVLANKGDAMDVIVHYEPDEGEVPEPTSIQLNLNTGGNVPITWERLIQAGEKQSKFSIGPSVASGDQQAHLWFAAANGEKKLKTVALYNDGLAPQTVQAITKAGAGPGIPIPQDFYLEDDGVVVIGGEFQETIIPPLGLVNIQVAFEPSTQSFAPTGFLYIWTPDEPFGSAETSSVVVNLDGRVDLEAVLPVAKPTFASVVAFYAGDEVPLDASESVDGDAEIFEFGFKWFLTAKPDGSVAKLNEKGGEETTSFQVDKAGTYRVSLVVGGVVPATGESHFSDEESIEIFVE